MAKGSDNPFPSILVVEGTTPASPAAGDQRLFVDSADHKLKRVNSSGAVATIEGGGGTSNRITASLSSNFTSTTVGAWTNITGLSASYTPAANERLMLHTRVRISDTAAQAIYLRVTVSPAPAAGPSTFDWTREDVPASKLLAATIVGSCDLAAGTAYTLQAQFFAASGGTLTVSSTIEDTELSGVTVPR